MNRNRTMEQKGKDCGSAYEDITVAEAGKLLPAVTRIHEFYERLRLALERQGFLPSDSFYVRVLRAQNEAHTVMIWTFYATIKQGVGTPERKAE